MILSGLLDFRIIGTHATSFSEYMELAQERAHERDARGTPSPHFFYTLYRSSRVRGDLVATDTGRDGSNPSGC